MMNKIIINKNQDKKASDTKGITLISLVITIIILLILAGITISQLTGSGLFAKAKKAKDEYNKADFKERIILMLSEFEIEKEDDKNLELLNFLNSKKDLAQLDNVIDNGETIIVISNGYELVIDKNNFNVLDKVEIKTLTLYKAGETGVENWTGTGDRNNIFVQQTPYIMFQTYQVGIATLTYNEPIDIEEFKNIKIEKEYSGSQNCSGFDVILGTSPGSSDILTYSINDFDEINTVPINEVNQKEVYFGIRLTVAAGNVRIYNIKSIQFLP